jgi:pimeloyl-ACP methyl ester carboxylesterase
MPQTKNEKTFKSFDGTKISYRVSGKGHETILCFNGIGVAKWIWKPLEEYFKDRYKIVTWDYRGHGFSDTPKDVDSSHFDQLAKDALKLIDVLKIKKFHFIGHSAGLQIALDVIKARPSAAKSLISCLGSPGHVIDSFLEPPIGQVIFDLGYILNAVIPETSDIVTRYLLSMPATYHIGAFLKLINPAIYGKEPVERYLRDAVDIDFTLFNHIVATGTAQTSEDVLPKLKVPVLFIASEHDKFVPTVIAEGIKRVTKGSELFIIQNGTHAALLEQPDLFNLKIEKFLNEYF